MADPSPAAENRTGPRAIPLVPLRDRDPLPAPLPSPLTSFVGREREVAAVAALLQGDVRLVTLTGPGGVGKTRLAVRAAAQVEASFADGVAFVPVAPIADPSHVLPTVAQALGVREAGDRPLAEALAAFLRPRALLLVLDNFEQVLEAAPSLADLLRACPRLMALVTSRAVLRVSGEHAVRVPPLALPDPAASVAEVSRAEAVRPFAARAMAADADFVLDAGNAQAVAGICARLDGLPLAVELAASRVTVLSPQAMVTRLETRLPMLTGGARDQPARLRSMRDAIAWSYDLLSAPERALFRRLAVFVGGCTLEAAETVSRGVEESRSREAGAALLDSSVFDGIASLVDKSLLRAEPGSGGSPAAAPRYAMLETVREYGLEQLAASGEAAAVRARHAAWCLELAEAAEPAVRTGGPDQAQVRWMARLDAELGNLRAALGWFVETGDAAGLLRMAGLLDAYWFSRPYLAEARRWADAGFAAGGDVPAGVRAAALQGALTIAGLQGDHRASLTWAEEALAIARGMDDPLALGRAYFGVGEAWVFGGDGERAADFFREAVPLLRQTDDPTWLANALESLGVVLLGRGDPEGAAPLFEEALALYRASEDPCGIGMALVDRAHAARAAGDSALAVRLLTDCIAAIREIGDTRIALDAVAGLAGVALGLGQAEQAARLLGAVEAAREATGFGRIEHVEWIAALRAALGEERFVAAFEAGRAVPPKRVVAEAMEVADDLVGRVVPTTGSTATERAGLTVRESEVLRLLAEGRSNLEIAAALFLSRRTVEWHIANVSRKFGLSSRAAIAAHAARQGII